MPDSMSAFTKKLKSLQSEGEDYSALGQILSKSSPASADLITSAASQNIQSQADKVIAQMRAAIARQQAEAQKRAQEAAQAQAAALAKAQADAAAKNLPKPESVAPQAPDPNKSAYGVDQEKYLDRYSHISRDFDATYSSPEMHQEADKELKRRLAISGAIATKSRAGEDVTGLQDEFAQRAKIWDDQYKYAANPVLPPNTETMIDPTSGERRYIDRSTIPQVKPGTTPATHTTPITPAASTAPSVFHDPSKTVAPKPDVTAPTGLNTPDPRPVVGPSTGFGAEAAGQLNPSAIRTVAPPPQVHVNPTIPPQNPHVVTNPQAASGTPEPVSDPYAPVPRLTPPMSQDTAEPRGGIGQYPGGAGIQGIATQPENDPVNRFAGAVKQTPLVTPETPSPETEYLKDQQTMVGPDPRGFKGNVPLAQFKADVPMSGDINPKFLASGFPTASEYQKPVTTDDLIARGTARPEDRDFWDAYLEQNRKGPGAQLQKSLDPIGGSDWMETPSGAKFNPSTGEYVIPDQQGTQQGTQQGPKTAVQQPEEQVQRTGTVLGSAAATYNKAAGKEAPNPDEEKIIGQAISAYGKNEDAGWSKPALETAGRLAFEKETGYDAKEAPTDWIDQWIYGYTNGKPVTLSDELDQDLLRTGVKPVGYENAESPPKFSNKPAQTTTDNYNVAFGFNQKYSNPFNPAIPNHRGVDLVIPGAKNNGRGSDVHPFQPGVVAAITHDPDGGNGVIIRSPDGLYHRYFHFDSISAKEGQQVDTGTVIGKLGASGTEGFPHLHFEVSKGINGDPQNALIDPTPYMSGSKYQQQDEGDFNPSGLLSLFQSRSARAGGNPASIATNAVNQGLPSQLAGLNPRPGLQVGQDNPNDMKAEVYVKAKEATGDDLFAHSFAALTDAEGGLEGARGDKGLSAGPFQFYWGGGEGNGFQAWLSQREGRPVSQKEAMAATNDLDTVLDYYIPRAYQFFKEGGASDPMSIVRGGGVGRGHNPGAVNFPNLVDSYREAWRRYQAGDLSPANKLRTIAGQSGG